MANELVKRPLGRRESNHSKGPAHTAGHYVQTAQTGAGKGWRNWTLTHCCWGIKWFGHCANSVAVPQNIENRMTIRSSSFTSEYVPKRMKVGTCTGYLGPQVHGSTSHSSHEMAAAPASAHRCINKVCV